MTTIAPEAIEYQRRRFTRHDAHRFIRPDAHRFIKPGAAPPRAPEQASAATDEMSDAELLEYRHELAKLRFDWEMFKLSLKASKAGFDPSQPRDDRGRWTDTGAGNGRNDDRILSDATPENLLKPGARLAQNTGRPIDLHEERRLGGHTIEGHVGKSHEALLARVRREALDADRNGFADGLRVGSFSSMEAATKLINAALAENQAKVNLVASGAVGRDQIDAYFSAVTGYEAYAPNERSQPYIRETNGVRVVIVPDSRVAKGYRVQTAFPIRR